ncbi:hypothetical protein FN846DRAFT_911202 [Sphaerosporella brunnea]|uniref:Uncharacterized protein n=1 Tax=Sphaerosporella brunnea TaxID=1250544 RepID=A0A5J5EJX3_9PEZI|nr:hypothetical protein FN846DRAFT_911202 [Sphaerosporella brunnea]
MSPVLRPRKRKAEGPPTTDTVSGRVSICECGQPIIVAQENVATVQDKEKSTQAWKQVKKAFGFGPQAEVQQASFAAGKDRRPNVEEQVAGHDEEAEEQEEIEYDPVVNDGLAKEDVRLPTDFDADLKSPLERELQAPRT